MIENLLIGLSTAFSLHNLLYIFSGVFLGNVIGVLPGIGPLAAIAMVLPVTYGMDPTSSLMLLAGLYYGTSFGGATTSILLNLPGTEAHAVICLDGNALARQGKGGPAIFIAMLSSFIGVLIGVVIMMFFSPMITQIAFSFGEAEYFLLMLMGLLAATVITTGSILKGLGSVLLGLVPGTVGSDVNSGAMRFVFGFPELQDGISLVALAMGLFGLTDILFNAGQKAVGVRDKKLNVRSIFPTRDETKESMAPILRGSMIGSLLGALPGTGSTVASFISYAVEKKASRHPERFGKGALEGVASPEAANSSADITAFIPTLTLGIPGSATMALMLGALMLHGIVPGPHLVVERPELFWGLVVSFCIGNILLILLNIPLVNIWLKLLAVPYRFIYPTVIFLIALGVYSTNNSLFDVGEVLVIGLFGCILAKLGFQPAPLLLSFVLGPLMEEHFRRALKLSQGNIFVFIERPISAAFVAAIILLLSVVMLKKFTSLKATARSRSSV